MRKNMNTNMNMKTDQAKQDQDQGQVQVHEHATKICTKQEQESRLLSLLTPPGQLHKAWTQFLLEVLCGLEEAGLIKRISPVSPEDKKDQEECEYAYAYAYEYEYKYVTKNLRRRRKVGSIFRSSKKEGYRKGKRVPFIRLSGLWLEKCGLLVGDKFLVFPKKDQLLLKKTTRCSDFLLLNEDEYKQ